MDPTTQGLLFTLLGVAIGAITTLAWRVSERQLRGPEPASEADEAAVPPGVATVLGVLRSSALVIDQDDRVLQASAPAYTLGLVRDGGLCVAELAELVRQVRRDGEIRQTDLVVARGVGHAPTHVHARVASLSSRLVLVLADDRTRERRVEAIRRDFVANVSHELKTPVGALILLAAAVAEASDDPEAVTRFATRMQTEATRLTRLVQQIIELSRLQDDEAPDEPRSVDVDKVVERAVDGVEIEATAKHIDLVYDGQRGLQVLGSADQISLALSNLLANAVAYSPEHSKVVVSAVRGELVVDLTVSDQGIGIPASELDRIFERFYRVDPARHRSTGGTGLGLSIVKHVAASHGGDVKVWSAEGEGSSFTLRLPRSATEALPPVEPPAPPGQAALSAAPSAGNGVHPKETP
jgi:two-component system sensor histidine kinase SenX3